MTPRQIAIERGKPTYEGRPCKTCGTAEKYTKFGACVKCAREKALAAKAKARGKV